MYPAFENINLKFIGLSAGTLLLFLAIHIFSTIRKNNLRRVTLLAITCIAFFQIITIVFQDTLPLEMQSVMLATPTLMGPLTLIYVQSLIRKTDKIQATEFINFVPFVVISTLAFIPSLNLLSNKTLQVLIIVIHWGMFILYVVFWLYQNKKSVQELLPSGKKWLWCLLSFMTAVWLNQSLLFLVGNNYQAIYIFSIAAGAILLTLFYFRFKSALNPVDEEESTEIKRNQETSEKHALPENSHIYLNKVEALMSNEKVYLDPNLTIPKMAVKIQIQPYLLSQLINTHFDQSFPDYINSYRIEDAKELLEESSLKISSIAADCGFNTLSSFNLAFKKHALKTPSQYRNELIS